MKEIPVCCPICNTVPKPMRTPQAVRKWRLKCNTPGCTNKVNVNRNVKSTTINYWNRVCVKVAAGEEPVFDKYTTISEKIHVPDGARCKCGLLLPCHDCVKPAIHYLGRTRDQEGSIEMRRT